MRKITSCSLLGLLLVLVSLFLLLPTGCGDSVAGGNEPAVQTFVIKNTDKYSTKNLNIIIKPMDAKGKLVDVEGELDIELWDDIILLGGAKSVLQKWDDVPLTASSFQDGIGNVLSLDYKYFDPEPGQNAFIHLTFTSGDVAIEAEEIITLFPMACCYE
jgi:hypothetical protein